MRGGISALAPEGAGVEQPIAQRQGAVAILRQQQRAVEIDPVSALRHQRGRRYAERGAEHAADHDAKAAGPRRLCQSQRFSQATGLVQLDIHRVEIAQPVEIGAGVAAFVGAERQRRVKPGQPVLPPVQDRLLHHFHAQFSKRRGLRHDVAVMPAFIGVDDQPDVGCAGAHGGDTGMIALPRQLAFEQAKAARYGGAGGFASTGGWTLARGEAMSHYSAHPFLTLTEAEQVLVERVSKNIYRPCCDNATYFPDCNHGMAMLGFLTLLAKEGKSEAEMYKAALALNRLWFPDTYAAIDKYLEMKSAKPNETNPKELLGYEFSSASGYRRILAAIEPIPSQGGGSCGV